MLSVQYTHLSTCMVTCQKLFASMCVLLHMLATTTIQGWSGIYFTWSFWLCGYYSKKHGNLCPDRFGRFPTKNLEILLPPVLVTSEVGSSYPLTDILWLISSDWYPLTDIPETARPASPTGTTHLYLFYLFYLCQLVGRTKRRCWPCGLLIVNMTKGEIVQGRGLWLIVGAALNRLISFGEDPGILRLGCEKSRGRGCSWCVSLYPLSSGEKTLGGRLGSWPLSYL